MSRTKSLDHQKRDRLSNLANSETEITLWIGQITFPATPVYFFQVDLDFHLLNKIFLFKFKVQDSRFYTLDNYNIQSRMILQRDLLKFKCYSHSLT